MFLRTNSKELIGITSQSRHICDMNFPVSGEGEYTYVLHHTPKDKDSYTENKDEQTSFQQEVIKKVRKSSAKVEAIMGKPVFFQNSIEVTDINHTYQPIYCDESSTNGFLG